MSGTRSPGRRLGRRLTRGATVLLALLLLLTYAPLGCEVGRGVHSGSTITMTNPGAGDESQTRSQARSQAIPTVVVLCLDRHRAAREVSAAVAAELESKGRVEVVPARELPFEAHPLPDVFYLVDLVELDQLHLPGTHRLDVRMNLAVGERPRTRHDTSPRWRTGCYESSMSWRFRTTGILSSDRRYEDLAETVVESVREDGYLEGWRPRQGADAASPGGARPELGELPFELPEGRVVVYRGSRPGIPLEELLAVETEGPWPLTMERWARALDAAGWDLDRTLPPPGQGAAPRSVHAQRGAERLDLVRAHDQGTYPGGEERSALLTVLHWLVTEG